MKQKTYGCVATTFEDKINVVGGKDASGALESYKVFDLSTTTQSSFMPDMI